MAESELPTSAFLQESREILTQQNWNIESRANGISQYFTPWAKKGPLVLAIFHDRFLDLFNEFHINQPKKLLL